MLAIPLILVPIAFAGGLYLVARLMPRPAPTPGGRVAARVMDLLGGLAGVVLALNLYLAVRTATSDVFEGFDRDTGVADLLANGLWQTGVLVALAAVVLRLAPAAGADDD